MDTSPHHPNGKLTAGARPSCWTKDGIPTHVFPELQEDLETEVLVIGAGLAGLTIGYCLSKQGKKVTVVEDGYIGSGETGRTTAQFVTALDKRYYQMMDSFGEEDTRLIARSHIEAIEEVERIVKEEKIECDFERLNGYLFPDPSDRPDVLEREIEAMKKIGMDVSMVEATPGLQLPRKGLEFPGQAQLHPLKYLLGLAKCIEKNGGQIFVSAHADQIDHAGAWINEKYFIRAKHVVVATNAPVNDKYAMMLKQWAFRSYVITAKVKKGILPKALWWDTGSHMNEDEVTPYHYIRLQQLDAEHDLLISGGEDHVAGMKAGKTEADRYSDLEEWTRQYFPVLEVLDRWSGEVLVPMDSIAYIGHNRFDRSNVYICTGDSGIGMTYCTMAGRLITDLILGKKNPYEKIYSPARFTWNESKPFFRMLKDDLLKVLRKWFYDTGGLEASAIPVDGAGILKIEGKKYGAYRDESGQMHFVSAECTHLKCMVRWNAGEKSWDCPCHGSRFTFTGKVINGPANKDLEYFNEE